MEAVSQPFLFTRQLLAKQMYGLTDNTATRTPVLTQDTIIYNIDG